MDSSAGSRIADAVRTALATALVAAALELTVLAVRKFVIGDFLWASPDVVWMAPVAYGTLFVALAPAFAVLDRWLPERWSGGHVAVLGFAFLGSFSVALLFSQIHRAAAVVLAAGIGVQAARMARARGRGFRRLRRWLVVVLGGALVVLGVGAEGAAFAAQRRAAADLPEARAEAPNVLLLILDTVRAASLGLYDDDGAPTPNLRRLAERGVLFERAIAPSPWTLPTHASIFTGRHPHELSADWDTPLGAADPTLAERFGAAGYRTAGFVANLAYATYEHGLDRGFGRYFDYEVTPAQLVLSFALGRAVTNSGVFRRVTGIRDILNRKSAADVLGGLERWMGDVRDGRRPFFAFVNLYDAHEPYLPPAPFDRVPERIDRRRPFSHYVNEAWRTDKWELDAEGLRVERTAYEGAVSYLDHELGAFVDRLERAGTLENTIVVITSDHGEQFGEHGLVDHGNSLYMPVLHVPLLVVGPDVPRGERVEEPVSLRDLGRTLSELAALDAREPFPGVSLVEGWRDSEGVRSAGEPPVGLASVSGGVPQEEARNHESALEAVVTGEYHYIRSDTGEEELYHLPTDPGEVVNLVDRSELGVTIRRLRDLLRGAMK